MKASKIQTLDISEFNETNYDLLAINTTIEDYLLAFNINQKLQLSLSRHKNDIVSANNVGEVTFSRYGFEDEIRDLYWSLVQNQKWLAISDNNSSLFEEAQQKVYLLPEFKNADYFLKIEDSEFDNDELQKILNQIKSIHNVSTVFTVDVEKLKSKNNLIF